jgi:hypothetical protein
MQVWPKNDDIRRVLYHPTGVHFRADGPADWPDDSYTHRRIAEGDVTTSDPGAGGTRKAKAAEPKREA